MNTLSYGAAILRDFQINSNIGSFLKTERTSRGYSIADVAKRLLLESQSIESWEIGKSSPPAYAYYSIVKFYGEDAYTRAALLDLDLQQESYRSRRLTVRKLSVSAKMPDAVS